MNSLETRSSVSSPGEETVASLSQAVSDLLASDGRFRLIVAPGVPQLGADSNILDVFETAALLDALNGDETQQVVDGELRTVVPLTFSQADASASCAFCHADFDDLVDDDDEDSEDEDSIVVVGATAFRVPDGPGAVTETDDLLSSLLGAVSFVTGEVGLACNDDGDDDDDDDDD